VSTIVVAEDILETVTQTTLTRLLSTAGNPVLRGARRLSVAGSDSPGAGKSLLQQKVGGERKRRESA